MAPFAVDDQLAYGFAATAINGQTEEGWCCACYKYASPITMPMTRLWILLLT
jgi:hypothetical protein